MTMYNMTYVYISYILAFGNKVTLNALAYALQVESLIAVVDVTIWRRMVDTAKIR